jgi:spore maturation protein CgeB
LFEIGREVVTFSTPEECVDHARYYLDHRDERVDIARAGQARTLRDHTYAQRMECLVECIGRYV